MELHAFCIFVLSSVAIVQFTCASVSIEILFVQLEARFCCRNFYFSNRLTHNHLRLIEIIKCGMELDAIVGWAQCVAFDK